MTKVDYRLNSRVFASDGRHVGTLAGLVADGSTYRVQALLVKESHRFTGHLLAPGSALLIDEILIPVDSVAGVTRDRIELGLTTEEVRRLPPYLSYEYESLTGAHVAEEEIELLGGGPAIPSLVETADKPAGDIEISPGESVMLPTGRRLGGVKEVLTEDGDLVGVVLLPDGLFKREVVIPRRFLSRADDLALFTTLTDEDLDHLRPFRP